MEQKVLTVNLYNFVLLNLVSKIIKDEEVQEIYIFPDQQYRQIQAKGVHTFRAAKQEITLPVSLAKMG